MCRLAFCWCKYSRNGDCNCLPYTGIRLKLFKNKKKTKQVKQDYFFEKHMLV
ncbi:unnamed protein product [Schistosoma margrebowiei]|uniref:Uncharacterized protein n=1 Tax=Schistosoma margrebowiei TaxID=48269 RepID=A0A3P8ECS2_9TREM|nr:unnamed protein product [Schistosoma margrebowiei]